MSRPARVAGPDEGVSVEELQLATRNAGMPLEALRYDVTPAGLHYLLIHYDIPARRPDHVRPRRRRHRAQRPLRLTLDDLRARPRVTRRVTMECAGNGRARLDPRPVSQPWLVEAVGTAEWTGTPLAPILAGRRPRTVDGLARVHRRRPRHRTRRRAGLRPRPLGRGRLRRRGAARVRDERSAVAAAARLPAPPRRPRVVRDGAREVAGPDHRDRHRVRRLPDAGLPPARTDPRSPARRSPASNRGPCWCRRASPTSCPGPGCSDPAPWRSRDGPGPAGGPSTGRGEHGRRRQLAPRAVERRATCPRPSGRRC